MEQTYYKITNKVECHNNYQYVDGLNVLDRAFEPNGSCVEGGLYFTTAKYIFKFLDYGCHLREITLPTDCQWVKDPQGDKFRADKIILGKRYDLSDPSTFQLLMEKGAYIHVDNDYAVRWASKNGYLDLVKWLMKKGADINANYNDALKLASINGHLEVVQYLVENGANIHANNDCCALEVASQKGHFEVVKYLVEKGAGNDVGYGSALMRASSFGSLEIVKYLVEKGADIQGGYDYPLTRASENGHLEVVKYLVKAGANIHAWNDYALKLASENGQWKIVEYLTTQNKIEKSSDKKLKI